MNTACRKSFHSVEEFRLFASQTPLLYFHVFETAPNAEVLAALTQRTESEDLILLDVNEDTGFLTEARFTTEITEDHRFISKALSQLRGIGAWAKGTLIDFVEDSSSVTELIRKSRAFAFRPNS